MATIPNIVILQLNFEARLESDLEKFATKDKTTLSDSYIESLKHELEEEFTASRDRHDKIVVSKAADAKKYIDDDVFDKIRCKYHEFWAALNGLLPKQPKLEETSLNSTMHQPQCKQYDLRLPRTSIPTFDGTYGNWMAFNNLFTSMVHSNPNLEPITKLQYLQGAVSGEAHNLIKGLELNNQNYSLARSLLINRFHHTRRLVNVYLKILYDIPKIQNESAKSIKSLVDKITECTTALSQLNVQALNYQLIFHLERILPTTTATEWEKSLGSSKELPEFQTFLTFLEDRFRILEMVEPLEASNKKNSKVFHINNSTDTKKSKSNSTSKYSKTKTHTKPKKISCVLCKGNHVLGKCERFTKLSQPERYDLVKKNHCCTNCLDASHVINTCWSKRACRVCNRRHNTLLHSYNVTQTNNNQTSNTNNNESDRQQPTRVFHTQNSRQTATFFGTAQVQAVNEHGMSLKIRALLDPCAEDNFILSATANTLCLNSYYAPSNIEVVGNSSAPDCTHRVDLVLKSMDNRFCTKISAGVVESLTTDLPSVTVPYEAFGFLSNLKVADPQFNQPGQIELLLGIGVYTRIHLEEFKRYGDNLIAENTLFGYVIRGTATTQSQQHSKRVFMTQSSAAELNQTIKKFGKQKK